MPSPSVTRMTVKVKERDGRAKREREEGETGSPGIEIDPNLNNNIIHSSLWEERVRSITAVNSLHMERNITTWQCISPKTSLPPLHLPYKSPAFWGPFPVTTRAIEGCLQNTFTNFILFEYYKNHMRGT